MKYVHYDENNVVTGYTQFVVGFAPPTDGAYIEVDEAVEVGIGMLIDPVTGTLSANPEPYVPVGPVPETVSPLQARMALLEADLLDDAEAFVATLSKPEQLAWQYASEVRRDNAIIAKAAAHLGLDDDRIDALFRRASSFA
ncbi:hypothetical protein [Azospirillum brasilense]|uniref:hypothetical protein n=1 Tax=Azospirillum brasilense TaxID=192 RepID=UPI000E0B1164|nr:hypothetical protein [Azospirillum brasilense]